MSDPSPFRIWKCFSEKQISLLPTRDICSKCISKIPHSHCYCCDKILFQDDYDDPELPTRTHISLANNWEVGKILIDGTNEIYNYRIICFVCNHYRIQLPLEISQSFVMSHLNSLATKEHISTEEVAKNIFYTSYSPLRNSTTELENPKGKCCILL